MNKVASKVVSKDGTEIAFEQSGNGQPVILVDGAFCYRQFGAMLPLAELLAPHFTVIAYDRRGRGESGDTLPYAAEREFEDIEALIDEVGEPAFLFGISSGAVLALKAAGKLAGKVKKVVAYEPPILVDGSHPQMPADYVEQINNFVASGRRGDAVVLFMSIVDVPEEQIEGMRQAPMFTTLEAVAHTLAYDGAIVIDNMRGKPLSKEQWSTIKVPALVIDGGASYPFMHSGADAVAADLPDAQRRTLEGQTHEVDINVLAPVLEEFFTD